MSYLDGVRAAQERRQQPPGKYAQAALDREVEAVARADEGERNQTLNRAAFVLGQLVGGGELPEAETHAALVDAGRRAGLGMGESVRTTDSGLYAGMKEPRKAPPNGAARAEEDAGPELRSVRLTRASDIAVRPVHWLWEGRIALGSLALLGGREGIGKSTVAYQLAADLTRGRLPGSRFGQGRAVIVAATEDSWEHTIVPRLMAAQADLDRVYRVDVHTYAGHETGLSLPRDLLRLEEAVAEVDAGLILLDPLMSRLDAKLDTHKDAEVRQALEPLVHVADKTGAAILGLIHLNKSVSTDPLTMLMGSRAFAAVARAVLFCMVDPEDETARVLGQPKNNLGRTDLPTLAFRIVSAHVADTAEGPVYTGAVQWGAETPRSLADVMEAASEGAENRTATQEAADWLTDWLTSQGGTDESAAIKREGSKAGHSQDSLKRARRRIGAEVSSEGFPRRTYWTLPTVGATSGESAPTNLTALTAPTDDPVSAVGAVGAVGDGPREGCSE